MQLWNLQLTSPQPNKAEQKEASSVPPLLPCSSAATLLFLKAIKRDLDIARGQRKS